MAKASRKNQILTILKALNRVKS